MKALPLLPTLCCGADVRPLAREEAELLAERFRALSDPSRVSIVNCLATADEVCVCDLVETLPLAQPTISHHLRVLREAGLVEASRRGTWAFYRLIPEAVESLRVALGAAQPAAINAAPASAAAAPAS